MRAGALASILGAMGRISKQEENGRRRSLIKLYCDMQEGIYPWPDGRVRPAGHINKAEILRVSGYSSKYSNAYSLFDTEEFQESVRRELEARKGQKLSKNLPDEEQLKKMRNLVNLNLLDRLENDPSSIATKDLVATRLALARLLPSGDKPPGIDQRRFPGLRVDKLIISLDGKIPQESLDAVKGIAGVPDCIEGHLVDDT